MAFQGLHQPTYRRTDVRAGIAHIGVGNFHRSHQAMYLDALMQRGLAIDWGICGIGLLPQDARMRDVLTAQDFAYTLVEKAGDGTLTGRTIGSIVGYMLAPDDPSAVLALLTSEQIRIVSLTITEGGYGIDRATGEFELHVPAIQHDLAHPTSPTTVFGYLTQALRLRRDAGIPPFTIMSCDNLPGNGHVARKALTTFVRAVDEDLADWIDAHVSFPNSMVDRITPVTTDADRALVREEFGVDDGWPVMTEPFVQWVLEDTFSFGRPPLEEVGVQIVPDVVPYELMKLRLLNASHQGMAYFGMLAGYTYVHEAVADPALEGFLRSYLAEALPTLPPVPGIDLDAYIEELFVRFRNPAIADTLARLAVDASDRIPKFVLPTVRDNLAAGRSISSGAALVASWAASMETTNEETIADPLRGTLLEYLCNNAFLSCREVFGDLGSDTRFRAAVDDCLGQLRAEPVGHVLARLADTH